MKLGGAVAVVLLSGCSGSEATQGQPDGNVADASPDAEPPPTCGPGPYISYAGTVIDRTLQGSLFPPLVGVAVTVDECPDVHLTSAATGLISLQVTAEFPFTVELSKADYLPTIWVQSKISAGLSAASETFGIRRAADWTPIMPGFDNTHGYLLIALGTLAGSTSPCDSTDGVSVTLPTHPEGTVHFLTAGMPPVEDTSLTSTVANGAIYISGIDPGVLTTADVVLTKASCAIALHGPTGNYKLAAGTISRVFMSVQNQ